MKRLLSALALLLMVTATVAIGGASQAEAQDEQMIEGNGDAIIAVAAVCINSADVQSDDQLQNLVSGSTAPKPGPHYVLLTDGEACGYYCDDGFDLNCDNKLGDFCKVELNAQVVKNVNPCLEASLPAVSPVAAAAPAAIAVTPTTTLAHTGIEDSLALFGTTVIGLGATAMALRAHARRRED